MNSSPKSPHHQQQRITIRSLFSLFLPVYASVSHVLYIFIISQTIITWSSSSRGRRMLFSLRCGHRSAARGTAQCVRTMYKKRIESVRLSLDHHSEKLVWSRHGDAEDQVVLAVRVRYYSTKTGGECSARSQRSTTPMSYVRSKD